MSAVNGFATWRPSEASAATLAAVQAVLREYKDYLPLTGRQIFYRLVAVYGYEKSENAASRLYGVLGRARRAGLIPFSVIRDGGGKSSKPRTWADAGDFWDDVRDDADHFSRDRQAGQPRYVELFCEAPGMMDQLTDIAFPYSVPVYGTRGYTGLSVVAGVARRALLRTRPTVILQVGDHDPSGEGIFESLAGDAGSFVRQIGWAAKQSADDARYLAERLGLSKAQAKTVVTRRPLPTLGAVRVALTREQVEEYGLPTAPPSRKDSRSKNWVGETCQLEAFPPDQLAQVVGDAIRDQFDEDRYLQELDEERIDRTAIGETLDELPEASGA